MDKSSRLSSFANNGFVMFSYINVENEYDLREWNMLFWEIFSQTFSHNLVKRYVRNLVSFDFWSYRFLEVNFIFASMIFNELMHVNTLKSFGQYLHWNCFGKSILTKECIETNNIYWLLESKLLMQEARFVEFENISFRGSILPGRLYILVKPEFYGRSFCENN